MQKSFYITTTLPYVNADPHVGFAMEIVQADVLARAKRLELGSDNVFFNTGTDEHGQKIFEAATKAGKEIQEYVDHYAGTFEELKSSLNLSYDAFIRTTDEKHIRAAQEMWKRCKAKGDIYEKEFEGLYCVGCERYLTERDMVSGVCVIHGTEPELRKEKNWFFNLKKYEKQLLNYLSDPKTIIPDWRRDEAINFIKDGLEDFSISREKSRLSWGVPVPDDDTQVMYVWFDALTNYISTLGWPDEAGNFKKFWLEGETLQMAGKDQVRFQSIMWQAMLMSADIKNTDRVFYHGFINSGGQKMSKSIGNVISPYDVVERYGTDATRYFLLREMSAHEDSDFTWERMQEAYNGNLANGLGNLVSRVMTMAQMNLSGQVEISDRSPYPDYVSAMNELRLQDAAHVIWHHIGEADKDIQDTEPFKLVKVEPEKAKEIITDLVRKLARIASMLAPFMPDTAEKIEKLIAENKKPETPLFLRKD